MKKTKTTKQAGFTLIELLVVISIIGVLSSIVLVSLQKAKQSADNAVALATTRQINNQLTMYFLENGGYPNPSGPGAHWYCIGSTPACNDVTNKPKINGVTISSLSILSMNIPDMASIASFWSLFETKKAEAITNFSQFTNSSSKHPVYYYCVAESSANANLCGDDKAWVFGPSFSGNTTTYTPIKAGDTGSPTSGWSS